MINRLLILLFIVTAPVLLAQRSGYQSGNVSANLILPLSIEAGNGELDFGEILLTGKSTRERIIPSNGKEFIVKGQPNRSISVSFSDVELNNYEWISGTDAEAGTLTFEPNVLDGNSKKVRSGDNIILKPDGLIGNLKINVGGTINVKAKQPVGNYKGLFVISVSY